jgi:hypothetical protein
MRRHALVLTCLSLLAAVVVVPLAGAQGGGGGGGGGGASSCSPLTDTVKLARADGNGNYAISVTATVRNCTAVGESITLGVSAPGSGTKAFSFTTLLPPGASFTRDASPIGSTPLLLHLGQTYNVVATLTENTPVAGTPATITTPVTIPAAIKG